MKAEEYILISNRLDCEIQSVLGEMWQEACDRGKSLNFKILSGSMSPIIEVGNTVKISRVEPSNVRIGDIVAFFEGHNVVVHRVIDKTWANQRFSFRHRGDSGASSGIVPDQNLIGRVTAIEKEGREISLDSRRHIISNRILGWRLRLFDNLKRMKCRPLSIILHQTLRIPWKLCRSLLLWHL
jgi:signal peptidase I